MSPAPEQQVPDAVAQALPAFFELGQRPVVGPWCETSGADGIVEGLGRAEHGHHVPGVVLPVGGGVEEASRGDDPGQFAHETGLENAALVQFYWMDRR